MSALVIIDNFKCGFLGQPFNFLKNAKVNNGTTQFAFIGEPVNAIFPIIKSTATAAAAIGI
jgi:hypothetical protein